MKKLFTILLILLMVGVMGFSGCQKKQPAQISVKIVLTPLKDGTFMINGGTYISTETKSLEIEVVGTELNP